MTDEASESEANKLTMVLVSASKLPGVHIDRKKYLTGALKKHFSKEVIDAAIETTPAAAGIDPEKLSAIADASIRYETTKVTAISAATGMPGGLAMIGTVPADLAQYFAHVMRIIQKLAYLYGWEDLFSEEIEEIDDETMNMMILFMGVMFGAQGATDAVSKLANVVSQNVAKRLVRKPLTKGFIYPIVKRIAQIIGVKMTKEIFSKGISKAIPILGGIVSGGITLATFAPMSFKLKDYLAGLETADPETYVIEIDAMVDDESFEE